MESKEVHQDLDKHDSKIAHLEARKEYLIRKKLELKNERDKIKVSLANARKIKPKRKKGKASKKSNVVSLEQSLSKFNLDYKELDSTLLELDEQIELEQAKLKEPQGNINHIQTSDASCNSAVEAKSQLDSEIFVPKEEKKCNRPDKHQPQDKLNNQMDCIKD